MHCHVGRAGLGRGLACPSSKLEARRGPSRGDDCKVTLGNSAVALSRAVFAVCFDRADGGVPAQSTGQVCTWYCREESGQRLALWNPQLLPQ